MDDVKGDIGKISVLGFGDIQDMVNVLSSSGSYMYLEKEPFVGTSKNGETVVGFVDDVLVLLNIRKKDGWIQKDFDITDPENKKRTIEYISRDILSSDIGDYTFKEESELALLICDSEIFVIDPDDTAGMLELMEIYGDSGFIFSGICENRDDAKIFITKQKIRIIAQQDEEDDNGMEIIYSASGDGIVKETRSVYKRKHKFLELV